MTTTRFSKAMLFLLVAAAIAGTASRLPSRFLYQVAGAPTGLKLAARSGPVSLTPVLSPGTKSLALHALANYHAAKPLRASDHFHRWRFDSLKEAYPLNSKLQAEVGRMLVQSSFRQAFPESAPLVFRSPYGWEVRQRTAKAARDRWEYEHHIDQFLATCAEIGAPLSLSIETDFGRVSIGELLDASRRSFDATQELCWTLVAYCSYLPEESQWQNRFGERCSYESMVDGILSLPLDSGSCGGTHKQYALAYFLNTWLSAHVSEDLRRRCEEYLAHSSTMLERSQLPSGAWTPLWATSASDLSNASDATSIHGVDLVRITGHQLEWVCVAPTALRPPSRCTAHALRFLAEALDRADIASIQRDYCAYSHAAGVLQRTLLSESPTSLRQRAAPGEARDPDDLSPFLTRRCEGSRTEAQTP